MKTSTPFPCLQIAKDLALGKAKYKNFVFSPSSIQLALSLLANGANGSTLEELLTFLEAENLNHVNSVATKLIDSFTEEKGPILSFAGGIWVEQSLTLKPTFETIAENVYKGKAEAMDFQNKAEEVIYEVNAWVEKATNGLIKSILPKSLDRQAVLLLGNVLYFKGSWMEPFYREFTKDSKFYLLDGNYVEVPSMTTGGEKMFITTFDDFKILRKPYERSFKDLDNCISMYIILPNKRDGLWPLVQMVGSDPLFVEKNLSPDTKPVGVIKFMLPKFKIKYTFEASKILKGIGLNLPFSEEVEFDEMVQNMDFIRVSNVRHKSVIEVNEEGTEAAAVTVVEDWSDSLYVSPFPTVEFLADHPFLFVVKNDRNGTVLFMGHVVNPLVGDE